MDEADEAAVRRAWRGLRDLGERCRAASAGGGPTGDALAGGGSEGGASLSLEAVHVAAGRRYVASLPVDGMPLGYLQLVLDDLRALRAARQRAVASAASEKLLLAQPRE